MFLDSRSQEAKHADARHQPHMRKKIDKGRNIDHDLESFFAGTIMQHIYG